MSNSRIVSYLGRPAEISNDPTFGFTVQDNQTHPNLIQISAIPDTGNIEIFKTVQTKTTGFWPLQAVEGYQSFTMTINFPLTTTRHYQFSADVSLIMQTAVGIYVTLTFNIKGASRGAGLIGSQYINIISADPTAETHIPFKNIELNDDDSKFSIVVTAGAIDILNSLDMMADVTINSFNFTQSS
jgi:hypothetical protein